MLNVDSSRDCAVVPPAAEAAAARLAKVEAAIAEACRASGRARSEVQLIGVSKFHPPEAVRPVLDLGVRALGENQAQELLPKQCALAAAGYRPEWHFIGTLQRNKVRQVIGKTVLIHSVDRYKLLKEIEKRALQNNLIQPVLLQLNYSGVANKQGFAPEELREILFREVPALNGVVVRGIMTMAELGWSAEQLETFYGEVHAYWQKLQTDFARLTPGADGLSNIRLDCLSMGMSNDYPIAIRHGATHIRVGTALFGPRQY